MAKRLLQQKIWCRNAGLHRRLACLRKPIVQTSGCWINARYSCRAGKRQPRYTCPVLPPNTCSWLETSHNTWGQLLPQAEAFKQIHFLTSLAVRYPDVLDLRGFAQEHLALALRGVFPVVKLSIVYPGTLHARCRMFFHHLAALPRAPVPQTLDVIMPGQHLVKICPQPTPAPSRKKICCRNVALHRRLACLRKSIVQTSGCYKFSGTMSFALQAGTSLK